MYVYVQGTLACSYFVCTECIRCIYSLYTQYILVDVPVFAKYILGLVNLPSFVKVSTYMRVLPFAVYSLYTHSRYDSMVPKQDASLDLVFNKATCPSMIAWCVLCTDTVYSSI
jgi:hypothetical protein